MMTINLPPLAKALPKQHVHLIRGGTPNGRIAFLSNRARQSGKRRGAAARRAH